MARPKTTTAAREVMPSAGLIGGKYMYDFVEVPTVTPTRVAGPNPHETGIAEAKRRMTDTTVTAKALGFNSTVGECLNNRAQLYRAGRALDVSVKVTAVTGAGVKLGDTKKAIAGIDPATPVRITFWTIPAVKRPRKPVVPATVEVAPSVVGPAGPAFVAPPVA